MRTILLNIFLITFHLTTSAQTFQWAKGIGGTWDQIVDDMVHDAAGNMYMVGHFYGTVDFDPGPNIYNLTAAGNMDIFITKLDVNGNFVWAHQIGSTYSYGHGKSITVNTYGDIVIIGEISGSGAVDFDPGPNTVNGNNFEGDVFIARYNSNGNFVFVKNFGENFSSSNYEYDIVFSEAYSLLGAAIYVTGKFSGTDDFDPSAATVNLSSNGNKDIFVCKFSYSGNLIWAKSMGGTQDDESTAMTTDASGNIYITGNFHGTVDFDPGPSTTFLTSYGNSDVFVIKLDASGNLVWARQLSGTSSERSKSIALDNAGAVYIGGEFSGTIDCDPSNATLHNLTTSLTSYNGFLTKLDASGNFVWAKNVGGQEIEGICITSTGEVCIGGSFSNTVDFDPGPNVLTATANSWSDIFMTKLDAAGNLAWTRQWASSGGGTGADYGKAMSIYNNDIYLAGTFEGSVDFDPNQGVSYLASAGGEDIFVLKMNETTTSVEKHRTKSLTLNVFPNPTPNNIHIQAQTNLKGVEIYNLEGQLIRSKRINNQTEIDLDLSDLPSGLYLLTLNDEKGQSYQQKIIKK
ncbi:T9SS type A sorting domain-containing protein [Aureispira anguillae]|uniref:T9SS type A sorting domain-containing protein n=1 Tax=Aureispira anguillae TaxID=2864201 RepID=A0A915YBR2_9BACT|nr:T9SS type A sorting domain-containing protein [Aureispira anguillae]BDS10160.1 T9SS type A sorting domain-containing protein [Aureispira anguillae]